MQYNGPRAAQVYDPMAEPALCDCGWQPGNAAAIVIIIVFCRCRGCDTVRARVRRLCFPVARLLLGVECHASGTFREKTAGRERILR